MYRPQNLCVCVLYTATFKVNLKKKSTQKNTFKSIQSLRSFSDLVFAVIVVSWSAEWSCFAEERIRLSSLYVFRSCAFQS